MLYDPDPKSQYPSDSDPDPDPGERNQRGSGSEALSLAHEELFYLCLIDGLLDPGLDGALQTKEYHLSLNF
jgi:hypothetical protein